MMTLVKKLPGHDSFWQERVEAAASRGNVLRFLGEMTEKAIRIGVREVPKNSPAGNLKGTDNLISIRTDIYRDSPLIIQGPGAGREVTAQAVLADILKIAQSY
jgi:aspartokinase/homoserine dehydrogenase 1